MSGLGLAALHHLRHLPHGRTFPLGLR
ncbi:hypothetical protein [Selenomonas sp. KH1T6]